MADESPKTPPIVQISADDLGQWRVEATAERRRSGLVNVHAFRVQALVDEVNRLRNPPAAAPASADELEEARVLASKPTEEFFSGRQPGAHTLSRAKHLIRVLLARLEARGEAATKAIGEIAALFHNRESAKDEAVARLELAKVALILIGSGLLPPPPAGEVK